MNEADVFTETKVQISGPLAEIMLNMGFGFRVPVRDKPALELVGNEDLFANLNNINLHPNKTETYATMLIVLGNADPETVMHPVEVWALATELTMQKQSRLIGTGTVGHDALEAKDFDLVEAMLRKAMGELTVRVPRPSNWLSR